MQHGLLAPAAGLRDGGWRRCREVRNAGRWLDGLATRHPAAATGLRFAPLSKDLSPARRASLSNASPHTRACQPPDVIPLHKCQKALTARVPSEGDRAGADKAQSSHVSSQVEPTGSSVTQWSASAQTPSSGHPPIPGAQSS
jgi:hypothetical protein